MAIINLQTNLRTIGFAKEQKYVTSALRYSTFKTDDIVDYACENSGIPKAQMHSAFVAIIQQIEQFLMNGHSLTLGNLGTFYLSLSAKAVDTKEKAGADAVRRVTVRFRQSAYLRTQLATQLTLNALKTKDGTSDSGSTGSGGSNCDEEEEVPFG